MYATCEGKGMGTQTDETPKPVLCNTNEVKKMPHDDVTSCFFPKKTLLSFHILIMLSFF